MARDLGVPYAEKQPYYFISYNSEDEDRVSAYAKALAENRVPMWYDNGIEIGSKFEMKIAEKIEYCEAVIMFLSKKIFLKKESYVHKEFELATEYSKKRVYVVMLDDIKPPEVPLQFRGWWTDITPLQCVNAYEYKTVEACVKRLIERASLVKNAAEPLDTKAPAQGKTQRIEYKNGDVYEGEGKDGKRTGKGKYIWVNGDVYEGDFADGKRTGKGKYIWVNGDVYEGDFIDGKRTGKGKYIWVNGDVYEGDFIDGKRTGKGKYTKANGTVLDGEFVNGEYQG